MDNANDEVKMVPIDRIRILNPRPRDKKKFELIVQSIRNLGLKKPIQVSLRSGTERDKPGYDLVCGQGRMEAFIALGHKEIPAVVVEVSKEERLLRSLVENMARRQPQPLALMNEIERLKGLGSMPFRDSHRYPRVYKSISGVLSVVYTCTFLSSTPLSWGCETILSFRWLPSGLCSQS